jgi:hypothetical protein
MPFVPGPAELLRSRIQGNPKSFTGDAKSGASGSNVVIETDSG